MIVPHDYKNKSVLILTLKFKIATTKKSIINWIQQLYVIEGIYKNVYEKLYYYLIMIFFDNPINSFDAKIKQENKDVLNIPYLY